MKNKKYELISKIEDFANNEILKYLTQNEFSTIVEKEHEKIKISFQLTKLYPNRFLTKIDCDFKKIPKNNIIIQKISNKDPYSFDYEKEYSFQQFLTIYEKIKEDIKVNLVILFTLSLYKNYNQKYPDIGTTLFAHFIEDKIVPSHSALDHNKHNHINDHFYETITKLEQFNKIQLFITHSLIKKSKETKIFLEKDVLLRYIVIDMYKDYKITRLFWMGG